MKDLKQRKLDTEKTIAWLMSPECTVERPQRLENLKAYHKILYDIIADIHKIIRENNTK